MKYCPSNTVKSFTVALVAVLFTCDILTISAQKIYNYELCVPYDGKPGHIISNKTIGIADTTIAIVKGQVMNGILPNSFSIVSFTDKTTGKQEGKLLDSTATFRNYLQAGLYSGRFSTIGFNDFIIDSLRLGTGQMQEIDVDLGKASGFITYGFKSKKRFTSRQLSKMENKLKNGIPFNSIIESGAGVMFTN
jgi:hypothetical protein